MRVKPSADARPASRRVSQSGRNEGSALATAEAGVPGNVTASPRSSATGRPDGTNALASESKNGTDRLRNQVDTSAISACG
ncbi:MAG: hypothetical protein Q8R06_15080 [Polaromonas sp.]|uniref:hypothetical protein n=1 Tax=Polaromonas sp. TaxID=1869339 RepID=UPI0027352112|nr:hypothetical protein [Polaromonas sp.]MDP3798444.1 hypothetical protein [Polaromonas sp.]